MAGANQVWAISGEVSEQKRCYSARVMSRDLVIYDPERALVLSSSSHIRKSKDYVYGIWVSSSHVKEFRISVTPFPNMDQF